MNLQEVRKRYPKHSLFLSATKNISKPLKITYLRYAIERPGDIVEDTGGVIYCFETNTWAENV